MPIQAERELGLPAPEIALEAFTTLFSSRTPRPGCELAFDLDDYGFIVSH